MAFDKYILRDVMRELKTGRAQRSMDSIRTLDNLSATNPRLREINAELHSAFISLVENPYGDGNIESAKERQTKLLAERDKILLSLGYKPGKIVPSACPRCHDEFYADGGPCDCLKKAYAEAQTARLSERLDLGRMNFENFDLDLYSGKIIPEYGISPRANMEILFEKCEDYTANFEKMTVSLFFNGGVGLGKTFLSACVAGEVSRRGFWTVYNTSINIFSVMEAQKFDREGADAHEASSYIDCDLLVIDDLGTEFLSQFVQSALYHVVNTRLCARKKTIINSNLMLEDFKHRYAPQTVSRIEGEYELMFFFGRDLRVN